MKRWLWLIFGFTAFLGFALHDTTHGQGPGDQGAKLRIPGMDAPVPGSGLPPSLLKNYNPAALPPSAPTAVPIKSSGHRVAELPSMPTDVNKDIEITPKAGQWILFLKAYSGPEAPALARALVIELRSNYNMQAAYIFNYGAEEKRREYERVQAARKKQVDDLAKSGLKGTFVPIPIRATKIDEQTGVLIGGYRDRDEALRALTQIRHLKAPDPKRFKLDITFVGELERDKNGKVLPELKPKNAEHSLAYVNPFSKAFPARNPSIKQGDEASQVDAQDLAFLRKLNDAKAEPYSLFTCKGKYTLVVKQFNTQFKMGSDVKAPARWFDPTFGLGQPEWKDNAGHNAHNMAEGFRKAGLPETYVLHTRFCSFVTIGGFDSLEDRRMLAMKELLETRFRNDAYRKLEMLPTAVPMLVPH
jgi:hypothetical protein